MFYSFIGRVGDHILREIDIILKPAKTTVASSCCRWFYLWTTILVKIGYLGKLVSFSSLPKVCLFQRTIGRTGKCVDDDDDDSALTEQRDRLTPKKVNVRPEQKSLSPNPY